MVTGLVQFIDDRMEIRLEPVNAAAQAGCAADAANTFSIAV
jgi:hypothetical protein